MCKDKSPAAARFGAGRLRVCLQGGCGQEPVLCTCPASLALADTVEPLQGWTTCPPGIYWLF